MTIETDNVNVRDLKQMRLERHWSQDQLAAMSGLSIRTIQRIENGENAGLESLKSLAAVFEINIEDSDKNEEIEVVLQKDRACKAIESWIIKGLNGAMNEFSG